MMKNRKQTMWKCYGKWIIGGLGAFLLAYTAFELNEHYAHQKTFKASVLYGELLQSMAKQDEAEVESQSRELIQQYPKTPYFALAHLMLAKLDIEKGELTAAKAHLKAALKKNEKNAIGQMIRVRLARLLASEAHYEEALKTVSAKFAQKGYRSLFAETTGDIYLLQGDKKKAQTAYEEAVRSLPLGFSPEGLNLKQANIGIKEGD